MRSGEQSCVRHTEEDIIMSQSLIPLEEITKMEETFSELEDRLMESAKDSVDYENITVRMIQLGQLITAITAVGNFQKTMIKRFKNDSDYTVDDD